MIHDKTVEEIADPNTGAEKLQERTSTLKGELLDFRRHEKRLIRQYESIIREYKTTLNDYRYNITKMFFIHWYNRIKNKFGGEKE